MMRILLTAVLLAFSGCGGDEPRSDMPQETADVQMARSVHSMVMALKEGEGGRMDPSSVSDLVENMEGYEDRAVGEHKATYDSIYQGAQELQQMVEGSASGEAIAGKINELVSLAEQLPVPAGEGAGVN